MLIAIRLRPDIPWEVTEEEIGKSWVRALEILREFQSDSRSAQRCVVALEFLHEKLPKISQRCSSTHQQTYWPSDAADLETNFQTEVGYDSLSEPFEYWNWEFEHNGLEDYTFLDAFNVL